MAGRKTLGLDLGTNSIGWAIVEHGRNGTELKDAGVVVFKEGVAREKGNEKPATQDRTKARAQRRSYFRRRMRKQLLLQELVKLGMCPLPMEAVVAWRKQDAYPLGHDAFNAWFKMNPYVLRAKGLEEKLSLHELGRVFYHMAQRRGFRSNRNDGEGELEGLKEGSEDRGIKGLNDTAHLLAEHRTLGKAGVALARQHQAIRRRYTMRADYIQEFDAIWKAQAPHHAVLNESVKRRIGDPKDGLLFFQRPLRSQKGNVGRCTLEPRKPRAPLSSLQAEVFNVLQIINNIRVDGVPMNPAQRAVVLDKFLLKGATITAGDLVKALKKAKLGSTINYKNDVQFRTAHTIPILAGLFDAEALDIFRAVCDSRADAVSEDPALKVWEDRWAAIYNAEETDELTKLEEEGRDIGNKRDLVKYARQAWGFDAEKLDALKKVRWKAGYHSLSRKALGKIIPHLARGVRYDEAVLFANLGQAVVRWKDMSAAEREALQHGIVDRITEWDLKRWWVDIINGLVKRYREEWTPKGGAEDFWNESWTAQLDHALASVPQHLQERISAPWKKSLVDEFIAATRLNSKPEFFHKTPLRDALKSFLEDQFGPQGVRFDRMYHHSAIERYPVAMEERLGSPRVPGLKNPMVERGLHTLRHLVNDLIRTGKVDRDTRVNLELAREMDSANRRRAWELWQKDRFDKRAAAIKRLREHFERGDDWNPEESMIEKMWLYQEAEEIWGKGLCVYTGASMNVEQAMSNNVDVEHTWPRADTVDNSKANKMLCFAWYNRTIKQDHLPAHLPNVEETRSLSGHEVTPIKPRLEPIRALMEKYEKDMRRARWFAKQKTTKAAKDREIQKAELARFHFNYWRSKYEHLSEPEIRPNFLNRQIVGTGMISRMAREYLGSYFRRDDKPQVYSYQGEATAAFRREWLGEQPDKPKDRSSHVHHAKDAAVLASIDRSEFDRLARHYRENDSKHMDKRLAMPWAGFPEAVNKLNEGLLVYHASHDRVATRSRYYLGKVQGHRRWATGDAVRGTLHKDTYYGRILRPVEGTEDFTEHTVVRKPLKDLKSEDVVKIVDPELREQVKRYGVARIQEQGYMPVQVKQGHSRVEHQVRRVRVFDTAPVAKNPIKVTMHRDRVPGREHKHFLYAAGGDVYGMAFYINAKGKRTYWNYTVMELVKAMQLLGVCRPALAWPEAHPLKAGFTLERRHGHPVILTSGTHVLMYSDAPEEIDPRNTADLYRRLYVVRNVEGDGRINLTHHMDARPVEEMKKNQLSAWDPEKPVNWLRVSLGNFNALVEGVDFEMQKFGKVSWEGNS